MTWVDGRPDARNERNCHPSDLPGMAARAAASDHCHDCLYTQSNWERVSGSGMDDYISKPIQIANHLCLSPGVQSNGPGELGSWGELGW